MHAYPCHEQTYDGEYVMKNWIIGDAIISCYVDVASFLVMVFLLILLGRFKKQKNESFRLYFLLCLIIALTCVACFVFNAMDGHREPWANTVALISRTICEFCAVGILMLWLVYVDRKLYRDFRKWTFVRVIRDLPLFFFPLLLIINLFTG